MTTRNCCFTIFGDGLPIERLRDLPNVNDGVNYIAFQREICPRTNRPHLQGYIVYKSPIRMGAFKRILGHGAHVEPRRGSHEQARDYATKEETRDPADNSGPWTTGVEPRGQGARSDIEDLKARLQRGEDLKTISNECFQPFLRYQKGIAAWKLVNAPQRTTFDSCKIYHGITGAGKSYRARQEEPAAFWFPGGHANWWDGYNGEEAVIIDEFEPKAIPYNFLKRLCDENPLKLPIKGAFLESNIKRVIITSNEHPREWYPGADLGPLLRRATIEFFGQPFVPANPPAE